MVLTMQLDLIVNRDIRSSVIISQYYQHFPIPLVKVCALNFVFQFHYDL